MNSTSLCSTSSSPLDEDKCHILYQLINAMGATNVVEAGTSFGVSTIYLALATAQTRAATGEESTVIATEKEPAKAAIAQGYWKECSVEEHIDFRVGDLLETLKDGNPQVDLLLLDSKLSFEVFLTLLTMHSSWVGIRTSYLEDGLAQAKARHYCPC